MSDARERGARTPGSRIQVVVTGRDRSRGVVALVAAFWAGAACGGGTSGRDASREVPIATDPRAAICTELEAGSSPVRYEVIQMIFNQNCVICHSPGNDLDLQAGVSWANLVNQPAPASEACGGTLVVPGSPTASYLYQKLTNPAPCSGSQMPRTDLLPDPLPACVIALFAAWITEGATGPVADGGAER